MPRRMCSCCWNRCTSVAEVSFMTLILSRVLGFGLVNGFIDDL
jgi:hypothetical protein